jgi:hypothetical protein
LLESNFWGRRRSSRPPSGLAPSGALVQVSPGEQRGSQPQPLGREGFHIGRQSRTLPETAPAKPVSLEERAAPPRLDSIPPSPPDEVKVSHSSRYSPRRLRMSNAEPRRETRRKPRFPTPDQAKSGISTSAYRGHRRRAGSEAAPSELLEATNKRSKLATPSELSNSPDPPSSYRGRRRADKVQAQESIPVAELPVFSQEPSAFSNLPSEQRYRDTGTLVLGPPMPPLPTSSAEGSTYRGRRRE